MAFKVNKKMNGNSGLPDDSLTMKEMAKSKVIQRKGDLKLL